MGKENSSKDIKTEDGKSSPKLVNGTEDIDTSAAKKETPVKEGSTDSTSQDTKENAPKSEEKVKEIEEKTEIAKAKEPKKGSKEKTESEESPEAEKEVKKEVKDEAKKSTQESLKNQKPQETTEVAKPKAKALILSPINKEEGNKSKATKDKTAANTPADTVAPAKVNQTNKKPTKTSKQPSKGEKATSTTKDQNLKLPFFRRIHVKIGYIVSGIIIVALAAFFGRVALWEHDYLNRMEGSERHTTATENVGVGDDGEEVDTTEPTETEIQEYIVAADKPRYFSIPSLGIYNARVLELGVKDNGELATPWNIYDMGWYTGSSLPGELGVSMFDGHGGELGYGVLKTLPRIAIGAIIKIEMGDGRIFNYRVVDTAVKAIGDEANAYMSTAFSTPEGSRSSLSIITCTGDYWQYSQTYSHRFFLRAVLEN